MLPFLDADQFTAYLIMHGLADSTVRNYRALFVRWCDWNLARGRDPMRPDPLAVRAWSQTLRQSRPMLAQARAMISHLCDALETDQVSEAIRVPPDPGRRAYRGLEHHEAVQLHTQALRSGMKGTAVLVGLYTFARRSEIASLAWHRIDFDRLTLTLERPKNRDLHTIPMATRLAEHLAERHVPGEYWVFPGRHGGHLSPAQLWRWIRDVAEAAGLGVVTPHQLRHTSLTEALDASHDLRAVQDLAGHADPAVTAGYTRSGERRQREVVESVDYSETAC